MNLDILNVAPIVAPQKACWGGREQPDHQEALRLDQGGIHEENRRRYRELLFTAPASRSTSVA